MTKRLASLSLDLDNKWSYMKAQNLAAWQEYPTYLPLVVPQILDVLRERGLRITFFVVGKDTERKENLAPLRAIANAGHEIANHSYHHEPWLHLYSEEQLVEEFDLTEEALMSATGQRPIGFRGPGFSFSQAVHKILLRRGYRYDASTFPTFVGPLARAYFFWKAGLSKAERDERRRLYGGWREGFRSLKPHPAPGLGGLLEIPVTTMPFARTPIHLTYLHYLAGYSQRAAKLYFAQALWLCGMTGVEPSILLHPLDFLGEEDAPELASFPAMNQPTVKKVAFVEWVIDRLRRSFDIVSISAHAAAYSTGDCPAVQNRETKFAAGET